MNFKAEQIKKIKNRPHGCKIILPPGTVCAFRGFTIGEIRAHERKHAESIKANKRTKARFFEIAVDEDSTFRNDYITTHIVIEPDIVK